MRHAAVLLVALSLAGCWAGPASFDAVAWQPPEAPPQAGPLAPTRELERATLMAAGQLAMPEDCTVDPADPAGPLYAGTADGWIQQIARPAGGPAKVTPFAQTGGTPLGLKFDGRGRLLACVSSRGLVAIGRDGKVTDLVTQVEGRPFRFANDVDVAPDGMIYFTESTPRFGPEGAGALWAIAESRAEGRLHAYDPRTGQVRTLLTDLAFANGCAVTADGRAILVAETARYRVRRLWLKGERAGQHEVWATMPGIPDGLMGDGKGTVWVALVPRDGLLDALAPHPWLRGLVVGLPEGVLLGMAAGTTLGWVAAYDEQGRPQRSLQDATGRFKGGIANVMPVAGSLYLGTKWGDYVGVLAPGT